MKDAPIKRRKGQANPYPGAHTPKDDKWKTPLGLLAVLLGSEYDIEKAGGAEVLVADPNRGTVHKISAMARWSHVCSLLPDLQNHVLSYGNLTPPHLLFDNRQRYLYYQHKKGSGNGMVLTISNEHPMRSDRRKPYWELARKVYHEDTILRTKEVEQLFAQIDKEVA